MSGASNSNNNEKDDQKQEQEDHVEDLKNKLYSNEDDVSGHRRAELTPEEEADASRDWSGPESDNLEQVDAHKEENQGRSWLNIFLLFSFLFFVVAVGYAYFTLFSGGGISPKKIDISVSGPISVTAGESADFSIRVRNRNDVQLDNVSLVVSYPENTRSAANMREIIQRERISLGSIASGQQKERQITARLLGKQSQAKDINLQLEYRVPNSNAVYKKQRNYSVEVASTPVSISVNGPDSVNSGSNATFAVEIESNTDTAVEDLVLALKYPFGFSFSSADPDPSYEDNVWRIDRLAAGESKTIEFDAEMIGQKNEERAVKFRLGVADPDDPNAIRGIFESYTKTVAIGTPFLELSATTDGKSGNEVVANGGDRVNVNVTALNNLSVQISDVQLSTRFQQAPINTDSVTATRGLYRAAEDIIEWNQRTQNSLTALDSEESASVSFNFQIRDTEEMVDELRNPAVNFDIQAQAQRVGETSEPIPQQITSSISKSVKVMTETRFESQVFHNEGPFSNSGPIPPTVGQETTYTVVLSLSNTVNHITDAEVTAELPGYIEWKGVTEPTSAAVNFNPVNGQLRWNVGELAAGAGYTNDAKTLAFQIGFVPASSQRGSIPDIFTDATFVGTDEFTGRQIESTIRQDDAQVDDAGAGETSGQVE